MNTFEFDITVGELEVTLSTIHIPNLNLLFPSLIANTEQIDEYIIGTNENGFTEIISIKKWAANHGYIFPEDYYWQAPSFLDNE